MKSLLKIISISGLALVSACSGMENKEFFGIKIPTSNPLARDKHIRSECVDGIQTTKIYIQNPGFESDVLGAPSYWKYGISKGWGIEADPTYLLDPQKGAGVFDITQHKVITFNTEGTGDNVGFLHRGSVQIKQTLDYPVKANATYTLTALLGRRVDIPFGSYRLSLFGGDELLAKTSDPVPVEGEFVRVTIAAKITEENFSIGRPLRISLINTATNTKAASQKTQVVVDNFELYEEAPCTPAAES